MMYSSVFGLAVKKYIKYTINYCYD